MRSVRRSIVAIIAAVAALAALPAAPAAAAGCPAAGSSGPITSCSLVSAQSLHPGVALYHLRAAVSGTSRRQDLYQVVWNVGDPHVQLHTGILGSYDGSSIGLGQISGWAGWGAPPGLVAALNGDFFSETWNARGKPSGLLVRNRRVYAFGWGGPGVGYKPAGDMVMGKPRALPTTLALPGIQATVGAWCPTTCSAKKLGALKGDQVAVYTDTGSRITIPAGYAGYVITSNALRTVLTGSRTVTNRQGIDRPETVVAFRFDDPAAAARTESMPIAKPSACPTGTCAAGKSVLIPAGGVLALAALGHPAAHGLTSLAGHAAVVSITADDAGWDQVSDVMGGKPQYVRNGMALATRPSYVDDWQWSYRHWRPAVVRARHGQGWLIVCGASDGSGIYGSTWGRMLVQLGAKNAMGFDNNSSTELYRPGANPVTAYGFERSIVSATALTYL